MRANHPEAYSNFLRRQTQLMSSNHTIVLNNIERDAMYYLIDHIKAIPAVGEVLPYYTVDTDSKYRVQVTKEAFRKTRNHLMAKLSSWWDEHVPEDAKQIAAKFPGTPEVAPIKADGYSSGEGTYMSSSINTAMSYTRELSDLTNTTSHTGPSASNSIANQLPRASPNWAARIQEAIEKKSPANVSIPSHSQMDPSLISDLASSRAEVDDLRRQLSTLECDNARQAQQQKAEMERAAEQQRQDFAIQLANQRAQLEQHALIQRREMEEKVNQQIAAALKNQSQPPSSNPPANTSQPFGLLTPPPDYYLRLERNEQHVLQLTAALQRITNIPIASVETIPNTTGKRGYREIVDLTVDHHDLDEDASVRFLGTREDLKNKISNKLHKRRHPQQNCHLFRLK